MAICTPHTFNHTQMDELVIGLFINRFAFGLPI